MAGDVTTIQIKTSTREELRQLGKKGETYDQLVLRLIELAKRSAFFEDIDRVLEGEEFVPLEKV